MQGAQVLLLSSSPRHRKTITRYDGLTAAGCKVVVAGYERENFQDLAATQYEVVSLGFAKNRDVFGRIMASASFLSRARAAARQLDRCDIIWANSLDMLLLALALRPFTKGARRIVYDVADLSPRQMANNAVAKLVRAGEKLACRHVDTLLLTSPWFYWRYYAPFLTPRTQVMLIENKVSPPAPLLRPTPPAPPWRIVWHGLLRCSRSLQIITDVARALPELVEVHTWGSTHPSCQAGFDAASALTNFHYHGVYSDTAIEPVFDGAHFLFAFDLDDGENSKLLLPNRLYHGAARALPLLGIAGTAIGRTAEGLKLGRAFEAPYAETLIAFFRQLTHAQYEDMRAAAAPALRANAVYSSDFARILEDILSRSPRHRVPAAEDIRTVLAI
jgi:succinoglycan biosynthesis protein ExoL